MLTCHADEAQVHTLPLCFFPGASLPFVIGFLADAATAVGDVTATEEASLLETSGKLCEERVQGCLLADGENAYSPVLFALRHVLYIHLQQTAETQRLYFPMALNLHFFNCMTFDYNSTVHGRYMPGMKECMGGWCRRFQQLPGCPCYQHAHQCVRAEQRHHLLHPLCLEGGGGGSRGVAHTLWGHRQGR